MENIINEIMALTGGAILAFLLITFIVNILLTAFWTWFKANILLMTVLPNETIKFLLNDIEDTKEELKKLNETQEKMLELAMKNQAISEQPPSPMVH